jgi:hypothetical protein
VGGTDEEVAGADGGVADFEGEEGEFGEEGSEGGSKLAREGVRE